RYALNLPDRLLAVAVANQPKKVSLKDFATAALRPLPSAIFVSLNPNCVILPKAPVVSRNGGSHTVCSLITSTSRIPLVSKSGLPVPVKYRLGGLIKEQCRPYRS